MSKYLGNIHYWLYNKIIWAEKIEEEIIQWARTQSLPADEWTDQNIQRFGVPVGNRPLEEVIDTSNIHGWLQERIQRVESSQAALITKILDNSLDYIDDLIEIFSKQGEAAAEEYETVPDSADGIFNALNDYLLEGMPCDRVNEIVAKSETEIVWQTTTGLHTPYWERAKGDVNNYYQLREAWIKAYIKRLNPAFRYLNKGQGLHQIIRAD